MKKYILVTLSILLIIFSNCSKDENPISPTTGTITGKVLNSTGDTLIAGASVTTSPPTSSVTTNSQGEYTISNVNPNSYIVTATKIGYNEGNTAVTVITGKVAVGDIKMNAVVNHAPNIPVLVSPSNGVTGQARTLTLSWTCIDPDGDNITYDVYLDKNTIPSHKVVSDITTTSYTATNLDSAAIYYWRIIAKDSKGATTSSSINQFTTATLIQSWNATNDFSSVNNPNGEWSYGRKWDPYTNNFDLFTELYNGQNWWFGNWGHGAPSVAPGPTLWAKNNSNGLPCVRWTCPSSGVYDLSATFKGSDSRGNNNVVYTILNGTVMYIDTVRFYQDLAAFSTSYLKLNQNDKIEFLIRWNDGIDSEYGWTGVKALIRKIGQ